MQLAAPTLEYRVMQRSPSQNRKEYKYFGKVFEHENSKQMMRQIEVGIKKAQKISSNKLRESSFNVEAKLQAKRKNQFRREIKQVKPSPKKKSLFQVPSNGEEQELQYFI
jgi:hypothetical protein